ncbi:MAG TPA: TonB-dependent receptor [Rhizomicrobium sp.]|nr:TonB-dependent receptor [Rhizomicrobium sp.]
MFEIKATSLKSKLLLGATTIAALSGCNAAFAQQVATESVVVTGSRIPQRNIEGSSPVTSVTSEEVKLQGAPSIVDLLKTLPSVVNDGDSDSVTNGSGGLATIDLRNLGTKRTLVLVDGKRLVSSNASLEVDTNIIPAGMVDRVEVLTGGDSAVYGSDAVAGVVNIILKKDFEGLQIDSQVTFTDHNFDGVKHDTYGLLGFNSGDGKGNLTIYAEYMHRDPVAESARAYGAHALAATNFTGCAKTAPATHFGGFCFSGSGTEPQGRIKTAALGGPYVGQTTIFNPDQTLVPYAGQTFNFAPYQYYQSQGERYAFGATGHYKVDDSIDFYTRLTFAENRNTTQIGPSPMSANFLINCGNPNLSVEERQTIFGSTAAGGTPAAQCATTNPTSSLYTSAANGNSSYALTTDFNKVQRLVSTALRLVQDGPRITANDHNTFQLVGGVRGDIPGLPNWTYDVSAQYGHTGNQLVEYNDALKGNFQNGLLVNPTTGACYSGAPCVPLNIFTPGSISTAGINYIRENLLTVASIDQSDIQAAATGDLGAWGIQSPWAKDPVGASIGGEYRQEGANIQPDNNKATGNLLGFSAASPSVGRFHVAEGFGELAIPIIQGMPLAEDLSLQAAYRFSSYDRAGDTTTYRAGGQWAPTSDFKFRASYDRAARAPYVAELFTPAGGTSSNSGRDPCSAITGGITTTAALCQATGVPAGVAFTGALNCPTNQCQGAVGGNPFLKPEVATTREAGIVLTPSFIRNFSATVDYYDINIKGFIESTPLPTILANCYSTAINTTQSASNPYCSFIHRDALGSIFTANSGYVVQAEGNIGGDHVRGIDFESNYSMDLSDIGMDNMGGLAFNYRATWVLQNDSLFPGAPTLHCAGKYGSNCGEPQNRLRGNLRTTWTDPTGDLNISVMWRYIGAVASELYPGFTNTPSLNFGSKNYIDLSATYALTPGLEIRGGIRNLFDQDPPLTDNNTAPASDINGNTFPNTYDALGRQIFLGVTAKL